MPQLTQPTFKRRISPSSACPLCAGVMRDWMCMPIDSKSFEPTSNGEIKWCQSCDVASVSPLPSREVIASFYDLEQYYTQGQRGHFVRVSGAGLLDRLRVKIAWTFDFGRELTCERIRDCASDLDGKSVCDIGCGSGNLLSQLRDQGARVIGVDPDPQSRLQAEENGIESVAGFAENLPPEIAKSKFDIVVMSHVLEHCVDPRAAMKNAAKILKPGGLFACEIPNKDCLHFRWFHLSSEMLDSPRHLHYMGTKALRELALSCGFDVREMYYHGFTRHVVPNWMATERAIRKQLVACDSPPAKIPPLHNQPRSFALVLRSMFARPRYKYDSVGFFATI